MPSPPQGPPPGSFGLRIMNRFTALNVFLYRRTGGRIGGAIGNIKPIALVDHVGAKSGTKRTTPLVYTRDGDDVIIVASQGGSPKTPSWVFNLRANPRTTIQIGSKKQEVVAREATDSGARAALADGRRHLRRLRGLSGSHRAQDPGGHPDAGGYGGSTAAVGRAGSRDRAARTYM